MQTHLNLYLLQIQKLGGMSSEFSYLQTGFWTQVSVQTYGLLLYTFLHPLSTPFKHT